MQVAHRTLALAILVFFLSACVQKPDPKPAQDPDIARASLLLEQGDLLGAASLYRGLAMRTKGEESVSFLLSAADLTLKGNDIGSTKALIDRASQVSLTAKQTFWIQLLRAELALAQKDTHQALDILLSNGPDSKTSPNLQKRYYQDLADSYRQLGNLLESANALQHLDALLVDQEKKLENQTAILRTLTILNELVLTNLQPSPPGISGGWMQLALLLKQHGDDTNTLDPLLQEWRQRFPQHPALPELLSRYQEKLEAQIQRAAHIAILLPITGPYAKAAKAVRDGIMISFYRQDAEKRPALRFYDSSDTESIWPLYSQAVAEGAEIIVGPLQKAAVNQLLHAGELPVPVLALNQIEADTVAPINLFMFALSPEDEARQAAERIWLDGHRYPMLLTPKGAWGSRIQAAFNARWQTLGGNLADAREYDAKSSDYSSAIVSLLHIDQSKARRAELQRWLGQRLEFEPRRRADADAVFIAARPRQAQSFPPQLQFHHAGTLPLYTTSHAWTGKLSKQQLADMKGIMLADIPLIVTQDELAELAKDVPEIRSQRTRLYALGMDAYSLMPHLKRLQSSPYESLDGQTGNLFMDAENRILRQTVWLKLAQPPKILGYAARLDLETSSSIESETDDAKQIILENQEISPQPRT